MSSDEEPTTSNEDPKTIGALRSYRTRTLPKNKLGLSVFGTHKSILHDDLDKKCLYEFSKNFVRIEYPGHVKNIDKAIQTLGGIHEIQLAVEGKKLELNFNPSNKYNKGCIADKDTNVGLLIKVRRHDSSQEYSYEILGPSRLNFKFNRMCDFQYLPLIAKNEPEDEESEVDYVYDKIITNKIPTLGWFTKKEASNTPAFLIAESFARFDTPQANFKLNSASSLISLLRPDIKSTEYTRTKVKQKKLISSIKVSFAKPVTNIPDQPLSNAMKLVKEKILQKHYLLVKRYFEERPVWRKPAIMHKTNISEDAAKFVLPCVAYYCHSGPWRSCWIKFGYDPSNNYNSRIYQVLDFRIRETEGMKLKVKPRRFLREFSKRTLSEDDYIIRPNQIPPARQMFYQYCDILIPEIQDMVSKLPKLPPAAKYDFKNGWLPLSFQEHSREIVTRYIFDAVQQEVSKETEVQEKSQKHAENISSYCSKMLSNIRTGVHQSMGEYSGGNTNQESVIEKIDLSDDDDDVLEHMDANEVVNSLPENFEDEDDDDDDDDEEFDLVIDLDAVEEVNEIVSGIKNQHIL